MLYIQSNEHYVTLYTTNESKIIHDSLVKILNQLCLQYGSTLDGRISFFKYWIKVHQKVPIVVSINHGLILMPLYSIHQKECILLNYTMIKKYRSINDCQSEVTFYDQTSITIDVNIRIIRKQMNRV
ncbi:MAG: competence protein ComK, partial [Erysipelotrichaceae bacterium]